MPIPSIAVLMTFTAVFVAMPLGLPPVIMKPQDVHVCTQERFCSPSWSPHIQSSPRTTLAFGKSPLAGIFLDNFRGGTVTLYNVCVGTHQTVFMTTFTKFVLLYNGRQTRVYWFGVQRSQRASQPSPPSGFTKTQCECRNKCMYPRARVHNRP